MATRRALAFPFCPDRATTASSPAEADSRSRPVLQASANKGQARTNSLRSMPRVYQTRKRPVHLSGCRSQNWQRLRPRLRSAHYRCPCAASPPDASFVASRHAYSLSAVRRSRCRQLERAVGSPGMSFQDWSSAAAWAILAVRRCLGQSITSPRRSALRARSQSGLRI
jgi:hypothetical protein